MNTLRAAWLDRAIRQLRLLPAVLSVGLVVACGGGDNDATHYRSVAMAGDLIDYTLDTTNLTYSYTIIESQYGLEGTTGRGTLKANADGSYTPSGAPEARVAILPNGAMLGAVRERFGTNLVTVPVLGFRDSHSSTAALAADYNYVQRGCVEAACEVTSGTFRIDAAGTWSSCRDGNLVAGACTGTAANGTLESRGVGTWRVKTADGAEIGTAMGFKSGGQNLLVVDLKDRRAGGFGIGMLVGGQQTAMTRAASDGTWIAAMSSGNWLVFTANASDINITQWDGQAVNLSATIATDTPWTGMTTTSWGDVGFMSGTGIYMLRTPAGEVELGVRVLP